MDIHLYNSLTKQKDVLRPIDSTSVGMYHCGPTVYNYAHIGNLAAYIFADILRRTVEYNGYTVRQVINITDFGHLQSDADSGDDKMLKGLKREGLDVSMENVALLSHRYIGAFEKDLYDLNIKKPTVLPRATEHIAEDITLIKTLEDKGLVYQTPDGLYFDTSAIPDYGRLGGISTETLARIDEIAEKKNPRDFALWKFNDTFGWPSPWGQGFPGWHIECSAMSQKYLGETFDIHTGGIDHIAIHHNNEIAQSEHATGKPLAHIWMHRAFINMNGEKIAKSTDNIAFLSDIIAKGISPLSFRYSILSSHYRTTSDFSFTTLDASEQALESIVMALVNPKLGSIIPEAREEFLSYINDDLNTPKVLAQIHSMLNAKTYPLEDIKATIYDFDTVLGLRIKESVDAIATMRETAGEHIRALLSKRAGARDNKDWALSDEIRDILLTHRIRVTDTPEGQEIWPEKILS